MVFFMALILLAIAYFMTVFINGLLDLWHVFAIMPRWLSLGLAATIFAVFITND